MSLTSLSRTILQNILFLSINEKKINSLSFRRPYILETSILSLKLFLLGRRLLLNFLLLWCFLPFFIVSSSTSSSSRSSATITRGFCFILRNKVVLPVQIEHVQSLISSAYVVIGIGYYDAILIVVWLALG